MKNTELDLRKEKGYKVNPFYSELIDEFSVRTKTEYVKGDKAAQHVILNPSSGEILGESRLYKFKKVDSEQFVKVFSSKMKHMWDMKPAATRVYTYILTELKPRQTEMYLHVDTIKEFTNYRTNKSVWDGIKWLVENEFMAKSYKNGWYWLNPNFVFNGDRVAFVDVLIRNQSKEKSNTIGTQRSLLDEIAERKAEDK